MITPLTIQDLDYAIELINARMSASDPVVLPPECREHLASCLDDAFQGDVGAHGPQLDRMAALLYWAIIKTRPLPDGNKRIAAVATALFLRNNGYVSSSSPELMYDVATSDTAKYGDAGWALDGLALVIFGSIRPIVERDFNEDVLPIVA